MFPGAKGGRGEPIRMHRAVRQGGGGAEGRNVVGPVLRFAGTSLVHWMNDGPVGKRLISLRTHTDGMDERVATCLIDMLIEVGGMKWLGKLTILEFNCHFPLE